MTKKGRTIRIKVYKFNELSDKAKQKALDWGREQNYKYGYASDSENNDTLQAFLNLFNGKVRLNRRGDTVNCDLMDDDIASLKGKRLAAWLWSHFKADLFSGKFYCLGQAKGYKSRKSNCTFAHCCELTGFFMDEEILAPIYEYMDSPARWHMDLGQLIAYCFQSWEQAVEADRQDQDSDEYQSENIIANEYEFLADGTRYH